LCDKKQNSYGSEEDQDIHGQGEVRSVLAIQSEDARAYQDVRGKYLDGAAAEQGERRGTFEMAERPPEANQQNAQGREIE
jgi:hypothetical protein